MSDPVTNVEIEDVLSSIRKLVAEESRVTPHTAKPRPDRPGRLVLTPAQRVKDDEPASEPVLLTQPISKPSTPVGERAIEDIPGNARLADFGNVEGAFPDLDELEEEAPDIAASGSEQDTDEADTTSRGDLSRLIEQEVSSALGFSVADDAPEAGSSEAEADMAKAEDAWLEEGWDELEWDGSDDAAALANSVDLVDAPDDDRAPDDIAAFDAGDKKGSAEADTALQHPPEPTPPLTLEDKVAALGRLVARETNDFEEERDRPDADDLSAATEPMTWPDAAPFQAVPEEPEAESTVLHAQNAWPQSQVTAEADQPSDDPETREDNAPLPTVTDAPAEPITFDEEMLREVVVDIVRQELQGALGERITRNVRKLVRREIHRMLISQDFD